MRQYLYLECDDPRRLNSLPGCRYVADANRGHGPEFWFDGVKSSDYPHCMALVTVLPGKLLQMVPFNADDGERLVVVLRKAGMILHESAKDLETAKPDIAAVLCYEQDMDINGNSKGKKPGATLRVAVCLAGDDPSMVAVPDDPSAVAAPVVTKESDA